MNIVRYNQIRRKLQDAELGGTVGQWQLIEIIKELLMEVRPTPIHVSASQRRAIEKLASSGQKIPAIKLYRQITDCGLLEAKQFIESLMEDPQKTQKRWNQRVAEFEAMKKSEDRQKPRLRHRQAPKKRRKAKTA